MMVVLASLAFVLAANAVVAFAAISKLEEPRRPPPKKPGLPLSLTPRGICRSRPGAPDPCQRRRHLFQLIAAARVVARGFVEHAATHQAADTLAEGATADS